MQDVDEERIVDMDEDVGNGRLDVVVPGEAGERKMEGFACAVEECEGGGGVVRPENEGTRPWVYCVDEIEDELLRVLVLAEEPVGGEADSIVNLPRVVVFVAVDALEEGRVAVVGSAGAEAFAASASSSPSSLSPSSPSWSAEATTVFNRVLLLLLLSDSLTGAMEESSTAEERVLGLFFWKASLTSSPRTSSQAEPLRESVLLLSMVGLFLYFRLSS